MLDYVITFFLLAIIAGIFGFSGLTGDFAQISKFLAVLFVILFVATFIFNIITGKRISPP